MLIARNFMNHKSKDIKYSTPKNKIALFYECTTEATEVKVFIQFIYTYCHAIKTALLSGIQIGQLLSIIEYNTTNKRNLCPIYIRVSTEIAFVIN